MGHWGFEVMTSKFWSILSLNVDGVRFYPARAPNFEPILQTMITANTFHEEAGTTTMRVETTHMTTTLNVRNFIFANGVRWPQKFTAGELCHHSVEFASGKLARSRCRWLKMSHSVPPNDTNDTDSSTMSCLPCITQNNKLVKSNDVEIGASYTPSKKSAIHITDPLSPRMMTLRSVLLLEGINPVSESTSFEIGILLIIAGDETLYRTQCRNLLPLKSVLTPFENRNRSLQSRAYKKRRKHLKWSCFNSDFKSVFQILVNIEREKACWEVSEEMAAARKPRSGISLSSSRIIVRTTRKPYSHRILRRTPSPAYTFTATVGAGRKLVAEAIQRRRRKKGQPVAADGCCCVATSKGRGQTIGTATSSEISQQPFFFAGFSTYRRHRGLLSGDHLPCSTPVFLHGVALLPVKRSRPQQTATGAPTASTLISQFFRQLFPAAIKAVTAGLPSPLRFCFMFMPIFEYARVRTGLGRSFQNIQRFVVWSSGLGITAISVRLRKSRKIRYSCALLRDAYLLDTSEFEARIFTVEDTCGIEHVGLSVLRLEIYIAVETTGLPPAPTGPPPAPTTGPPPEHRRTTVGAPPAPIGTLDH
ncbi:hypothetical protein LXL04_031752 [Taraxacum kok-saghyz]